MALNAPAGFDGVLRDIIVEDFKEAQIRSDQFFRALHYRQHPYPKLKGSRVALWIARHLGVRADLEWVKDADWEPVTVTWDEDD